MARRAGFGQVTKLPSGRYRARYQVPESNPRVYVNAPSTFDTRGAADTWLSRQRVDLVDGVTQPKALIDRSTLTEYADRWLTMRLSKSGAPLRPSTMRTYRHYLDHHITPKIGALRLSQLTPDVVSAWWSSLDPGHPTVRARTYSFLRTVLGEAVLDGLLPTNPCRIRGAGSVSPATTVHVATLAELDELTAAMPARLRLSVDLGAWTSLRNGEVLELRRADITPSAVHVTRGVTFGDDGTVHVGPPKTRAGVRVVAIPPHLSERVAAHLDEHVPERPDALLFAADPDAREHIRQQTYASTFKSAVVRTSLPRAFRFHWLRHTGLTFAAQTGATVAELQARAGHSTPSTAMRYQHATTARDRDLAAALSALVPAARPRLTVVRETDAS